jgi:Big-like domain-containing protein/parallel beta helix pectate lyase-like protein
MTRLSAALAALAAALVAVVVLAVVPRAGGADCTNTVSSASLAVSALGAAGPGATICLADGSYGKLTLTATKAAPGVTIRAEHAGKATIDGATLTGANVTLADLDVTDEIQIMPGSSGITISHNRITGGYMGINMWTDDVAISDTTVTGNKFVGPFGEDAIRANRYHDGPDADPYGLLVEGNEFTGIRENGNHSDCLQSVWVGDHLYFRRNYLHDNRCQGFFVKDQKSTVDTVVVEDNLFLRNNAPCAASGCGQPWALHLFGPMSNLTLRRNTIWTTDGATAALRESGWSNVTIDSNVIYRAWSDTSAPFSNGYTATNNVAGSGPEVSWPSTGFTVDASPPFQNPAADDYRTGDGRGVTWAPADQVYGPGGSDEDPGTPTDTTPPSTTISSGPSGSTTATSATFAFASSESGSTFECKLDAGAFAACTSPKGYTGLAVGAHTFSVRAKDAAGNVDASPATAAWTVAASGPGDTAPPETTIGSGPSGPTNDATPTFAFGASEAGATFACRVDDGAWSACTSPWTTSTLADGAHSVSVRATDAADNTDESPATRSFTVDTSAPHTQITSAPSGTSDSAQATVAFTVDETGATSECRLDDDAWVACTSPHQVSGLGDGAHTLAVRSRDAAGNVESPGASASWTVALPDGGDPGTPSGGAPTVGLGLAEDDDGYLGRTLELAATPKDDHGIDHIEFWVDRRLVDTDEGEPYATRVSASALAPGTHTISVRAFDAAGQAASAAMTARVYDGEDGNTWSSQTRRITLASVDNGDGAIHLSGRTSPNRAVSVGLARCGDGGDYVVDRFTLTADDRGRLDLTYAGANRCVLELRSRWW